MTNAIMMFALVPECPGGGIAAGVPGEGSVDLHPLHFELVIRAVHDVDVRTHRPGDHLVVQRDMRNE
jgi:hypothetical protein